MLGSPAKGLQEGGDWPKGPRKGRGRRLVGSRWQGAQLL